MSRLRNLQLRRHVAACVTVLRYLLGVFLGVVLIGLAIPAVAAASARGHHTYDRAIQTSAGTLELCSATRAHYLIDSGRAAPADATLMPAATCFAAEAGAGGVSDLATVTEHLGNIDAMTPPNAAMLSRIEEAISSGRPLTPGEQNFMTHELTESQLMSSGVPQDLAHEMAGQTHPTFANYDPEVIKHFPDYFNSNWRAYWGLPQ